MSPTLVYFVGIRRDGRGSSGARASDSAADVAKDLFDKGWRSATLTVSDDEFPGPRREVGGITRQNGRRIWWAET